MESREHFEVSWNSIVQYIQALCEYLREHDIKATGVYGIPRGGLILATLLSYTLDIPLLQAPAKNCIIIDDTADSGRTLQHYVPNDTQDNKYFITTMFYCERSCVEPDFYMYVNNDNKWIDFPWEVING